MCWHACWDVPSGTVSHLNLPGISWVPRQACPTADQVFHVGSCNDEHNQLRCPPGLHCSAQLLFD